MFLNKPLHTNEISANEPYPYPWNVLCIEFCYTPSVGVIGLAEYVCTHPILTFTVEDPDYVPEDNE
jgi:hypothetical protein